MTAIMGTRCFTISLCATLLLSAAASAQAVSFNLNGVPNEDIQLVARRLHESVSGCMASAEAQQERAEGLDRTVDALLQAQNQDKNADLYGAFTDVQPEDDKDIDFARGYFDPVRTLAQAYALPASKHYHSPDLLEAIRSAFIYTRKHVYPGCPKPGNWWVWAKYMPDCLTDMLALLHGALEPEDKAYLVSVLDYLVGTGPIKGSGYHTGKAGKDAVNVLKVGVLTGDRERIANAWECMENEVGPYLLADVGTPLTTVIKPEFLGLSLPYIYEGYDTIVEWTQLTHGTPIALRDETVVKVVYYAKGLGLWNTYEDTEIAWISHTPYNIFWRPARSIPFARQLAALPVPHADQLREMLEGQSVPDGIRHWGNADTLIYRSPGFYCALVRAAGGGSRQRLSWSYKNTYLHIGNKWYYGRDGHLIIATDPKYTNPNLDYTFNWRYLCGTTRDDGSVLESDQFVHQGSGDDYWQPEYILCRNPMTGTFVVGHGINAFGVAGLEVESGAVRARKSYFFLRAPEWIVMIGSHIQGRGHTETTVHTIPVDRETRVVANGEPLELVDGERQSISTPGWIHGPAGGYYFPEAGEVTVFSEVRQPDFFDHGDPPPEKRPDVPPQRYVTIVFDHGDDPVDGAYAWVYLPKATLERMSIEVDTVSRQLALGNEGPGHYVEWKSRVGLAFYQSGRMAGFEADRPFFVVPSPPMEASLLKHGLRRVGSRPK